MVNISLKGFFFIIAIPLLVNGCVLTKVVTVPMRVGGAVVSIVPGVGDTMHEVVDKAAEEVDNLPF